MFKRIALMCFLALGLTQISSAARYYISPNSDLIGEIIIINAHAGDSIASLAKQYDMGINEMVAANKGNRYHAWSRFKGGETVVIPSRFILPEQRTGLIINVSELRIYFFPSDQPNIVYTYPIAAGKDAWRTPSGKARVVKKKMNPEWNIPESIRQAAMEKKGKELPHVMPSGPDNPLGYRAIYLSISGYLLHGNNSPASIGTYASSGCIRLYNQDVEELFEMIGYGLNVRIVYFSNIVGYHNGKVYMENNPIVVIEEDISHHNYSAPNSEIDRTMQKHGIRAGIHHGRYQKSIRQRSGIPTVISMYPDEY